MSSSRESSRLRLLASLGLLVLILVALGACAQTPPVVVPEAEPATPAEPAPETAAPGGALTLALATEPESLDPAAGVYIAERFILPNLFDTLIRADASGDLHPGLAESWESNADATEFTLNLRDDVTFHDGAALDAEAVKAAFDRIQNVEGFSTAVQIMAGYAGTEVVDANTVKVTFDVPKPTFFVDLSQPWMGIPSPAATANADFGQNPVGTGPFAFGEWAVQDHLTLVRNPDYAWGPEFASHDGPALLDEVSFRFLPEPAIRLAALQTGEVDVAEDPPAFEAGSLIDSPDYKLESFMAPGMPAHIMINTEKSPTDDLRVRQAIIYAVNQEELVQTAFNSLYSPADNVLAPTTFSYNEAAASLYSYDPAKAAALLEEAGWVDSDGDGLREKDGETLSLVYPASPVYEGAYMELLAAYLNAAGFDVELTTMDDAGIFEFAVEGNHNLVGMGWTSADPVVLNYVYNSANIDGGSGFTRFRDEALDQALNDAAVELDADARRARYEQAQQIIMENALALPLHTYDRVMLMKDAVQGWVWDSEGYPMIYEISIAP